MTFPKLFALRGCPKFVTDGCSGYLTWAWNLIFGHNPPWNGCCVTHDWFYWSGGLPLLHISASTRRAADAYIFRCINRKGFRFWAWVCWLLVRFGGSQYLPFSWRWRYRDPYADVLWELVPDWMRRRHHEPYFPLTEPMCPVCEKRTSDWPRCQLECCPPHGNH